ncbi:MAG: BlaI/MecI/CopY family transcriptional regulator [bacterium]|nr:BlaI/MecI/CopY family transcriptional regulator [bacterium]
MTIEGEGRRAAELGPLEAAVMNSLWRTPDALDVESVHAQVAPQGRPVRNTVQSTLERLVKKGLVERTKHGRAYRYAARVERRAWFAGAVGALADALRSRPSQDLLAGFVDFAERTDPEALETLRRLVHERIDERGGGSSGGEEE